MIFIINYSEANANSTNSIIVLSVVLIVELSVVIFKMNTNGQMVQPKLHYGNNKGFGRTFIGFCDKNI